MKKLTKPFLFLMALTLGFIQYTQADEKHPSFKDYPVPESEIYTGNTAPVKLDTEEAKMFKTRLTKAAEQKPNFAGHYILASWGCGANCATGAVIDAKDGKVYSIPFAVSGWDTKAKDAMECQLNSRLIIFNGMLNEEGNKGKHYYKFENNQFIPIQKAASSLP